MSVVTVEAPIQTTTRYETKHTLLHKWGDSEQTAIRLEALQEAWDTLDDLIGLIGLQRARELLLCESEQQAACAYFPQCDEKE